SRRRNTRLVSDGSSAVGSSDLAALRAAFAELPQPCRELLSLLMSDPAPAYAEVSARLGMAIGSIGPTRARCLDRLRRSPHLLAEIGRASCRGRVEISVVGVARA